MISLFTSRSLVMMPRYLSPSPESDAHVPHRLSDGPEEVERPRRFASRTHGGGKKSTQRFLQEHDDRPAECSIRAHFHDAMLRQSLPENWTFTVEESDVIDAEFYVYAYEPGPGVTPWEVGISRDGMTVAEAADAVREALELKQR